MEPRFKQATTACDGGSSDGEVRSLGVDGSEVTLVWSPGWRGKEGDRQSQQWRRRQRQRQRRDTASGRLPALCVCVCASSAVPRAVPWLAVVRACVSGV